MNQDILITDGMLQSTGEEGVKTRRSVWIILAVGFTVLIIASWCVWKYVFLGNSYTKLVSTGVYVNSAIYMPDVKLEETPTEENVGELVGFVSFDNKKKSKIRAFRYLPIDEEAVRIIIPNKGNYDVYVFDGYVPDGTDRWPAELLKDAAYAEIVGHDTQGEVTEKVLITEEKTLSELTLSLSQLGVQRSQTEISQRYFDIFKDRFSEGAIWINDDGRLCKKDSFVQSRLFNMIHENEKKIIIHMEDHTKLIYNYYPAAGLIQCYYGYFLSEVQVEQINRLIGVS